jgi:Spy/CpxP family protein refolding chaperone
MAADNAHGRIQWHKTGESGMKRLALQRLALTALVTAALNATPASAMEPHGGFHHDEGRTFQYLVSELELNASQEAEIRSLHEAAAREGEADRRQLQRLRERLHELMDDFDAGEAQKLADEIGEITTRLAYSMVSTRAAMRSLLTEQQRQQLTDIMTAHRERGRGHDDAGKRRRGHSDDPSGDR